MAVYSLRGIRTREESEHLPLVVGEHLAIGANLRPIIELLELVFDTQTDTSREAQLSKIRALLHTPNGRNLGSNIEKIKQGFEQIEVLKREPAVSAYRGDLVGIENTWQVSDTGYIAEVLLDPTKLDTIDIVAVGGVLERLKQLRFKIAEFTIPKRILNHIAETGTIGAGLDFHEAFKDELPDPAERLLVLQQLANLRPSRIRGLVDVEGGMIFRIGNFWDQLVSYTMILLTGVLGFFVLEALINRDIIDFADFAVPLTPESYAAFLTGYLALMGGVVLHILKKATEYYTFEVKRGIPDKTGPSIGRLLLWIHVRQGRFVLTVASAVLAYAVLGEVYPEISAVSAFATGYIIDSLSDLVLQRFNTQVSKQSQGVLAALQAAAVRQ